MRRPLLLAIIALLIVGIALRVVQLDKKVFWIDEAFTALRISGYDESEVVVYFQAQPLLTAGDLERFQSYSRDKGILDTIRGLAVHEPQLPPVYFVLVRAWAGFWGSSIAAIRSFSAVASLLAVGGMYFLAAELFGSARVGGFAAALLAISPFQVLYAQEARPYSLWTLTLLLASFLLLRALRRDRPLDWWLYAIALVSALYTFLFSIFVVFGYTLYVFAQAKSHTKKWAKSRRLQQRYLIFTGVAIASLIPWLVLVWRYRQQSLEGVGWALQSGAAGFGAQLLTWGLHFTRAFVDFDAGIRFDPSHLFPYLLVVLAIAALLSYALYNLRQQKPRQFWFVLALTAVSALCLILLDLILGGGFSSATRYTVPCLLGATLAIAFCLATQTGQQQPPATRRLWGWIAASLYSLGVLSCISNAFAISGWHKTGGYLPYVAEVINQTPRPLVVADFDLWILPLSHYLKASTAIEMFDSSLGSPQIPPGFSHYFVVNAPADFVTAWAAATDYQLLPLEGLDQVPVWCLQQDAEPTRCPPIARN